MFFSAKGPSSVPDWGKNKNNTIKWGDFPALRDLSDPVIEPVSAVSPALQVDSLPSEEDPLGEGMATQSSILAWRIPQTKEPGGLWSIGSHRVRHDGIDLACRLPLYPPSHQSLEEIKFSWFT